MKFEEWLSKQSVDDQEIFNKIIDQNMSLVKGHNGLMYTTKDYLIGYKVGSMQYHLASREYESFLVDNGIGMADYPLPQSCYGDRWTTKPYKK
jgi:hypothetical protein